MGEMLGKTAYAALAEVLFSIEIPFFKLVAEGINDNILLRQLSAENALLMARAGVVQVGAVSTMSSPSVCVLLTVIWTVVLFPALSFAIISCSPAKSVYGRFSTSTKTPSTRISAKFSSVTSNAALIQYTLESSTPIIAGEMVSTKRSVVFFAIASFVSSSFTDLR